MVGGAIMRLLKQRGFENVIGPSSKELDLTRQNEVESFFTREKPEYVFLAAAKVGGIYANNTFPADFISLNLQIQNNVISAAHKNTVKKLLFLGSSCIYPRLAPQPLKEEYLLSGALEPTNEAYAIAKIAGLKMCEFYNKQYGANFISAMPTNLYGTGDNYDPMNSHVLPALLRRFHEAKKNNSASVTIWGSGKPLREFLFVDDLADACIFLMHSYAESKPINVGSGHEISILQLAELIKDIVAFAGDIVFDGEKPDGTPRKLLDSGRISALGWKPETALRNGIEKTYASARSIFDKGSEIV